MIIRPAEKADTDAIAQLWLEFVEYHRQLDDATPRVSQGGEERYAMQIRWSIEDNYAQAYVAEKDGEIIGYVYGMVMSLTAEMFVDERAGMVGDIYVKPAYHGQGVGKALMQAMKDWFKLQGVSYYEWYVAIANERGIRFWQDVMGGKPFITRMRAYVDHD
jgi:GNAT superfamily N-acetyltransferase